MDFKNYVQLVGRLGCDPIVRDTKNGKVARFSIAVNEPFDENGQTKNTTDWHFIVAWDWLAEMIDAKCKKGSEIMVSGKLTSRSYEDKDKVKHYVTEIVAGDIICHPQEANHPEA